MHTKVTEWMEQLVKLVSPYYHAALRLLRLHLHQSSIQYQHSEKVHVSFDHQFLAPILKIIAKIPDNDA